MSTQLILYPQNYKGYSATTTGATEYVVDGINFTSINSASQGTLATLPLLGTFPLWLDLISNYPASIVNTWYTFRSDGNGLSGVPAYPFQTGNKLILDGAASWSWSGVYQRFSNITSGQVYIVRVEVIASGSVVGNLQIRRMGLGSSAQLSSQAITATTTPTTYTATFTANLLSGDGIIVAFYALNTSSIKVESISVEDAAGSPSLIYTDIQDGQVICDLYQEEDIPLTLRALAYLPQKETIKSSTICLRLQEQMMVWFLTLI